MQAQDEINGRGLEMNTSLERYLSKMVQIEEQGYAAEAVQLADKILEAFPGERELILLEKAKMEFRNEMDKSALLDFIASYNISGNEEIYELVLEAYYAPNEAILQRNFQKNTNLLKNYPHYRNADEQDEPETVPVWQDDDLLVYVNTNTKQFSRCSREQLQDTPKKNQVVMMGNSMWMDDILLCEEKGGMEEHFMDAEVPMYLAFDEVCWMLFIQLYDLEALMDKNRIVFLVGEQGVYDYLHEDMTLWPHWLTKEAYSSYGVILRQLESEIVGESEQNRKEVESYYQTNVRQICERIKAQTPRIMFYTSRFTTALQYHIRDCRQAAERLGCETELMIEPDGLHRKDRAYGAKMLAQFKPDIVFCIDHFRFEIEDELCFPKEGIWVAWIQDPMPDIINKETPAKLTRNDFIMNHFSTWKKIQDVGYPKDRVMDAPIPANQYIYQPYALSAEEKEKYSCDICMVCHAADVDGHIDEVCRSFPKEWEEPIYAVYKGYQQYAIESGTIFYGKDVFEQYLQGVFRQKFGVVLNKGPLNFLAEDMYMWFNQTVYRQALADWLIAAGYTNLKLWGNGWLKDKKYVNYAMGPAENGIVLSKILRSSKIVLGNNVNVTGSARAWETMLSGVFYMSNDVPMEEDAVDIRKMMAEGENLVMFHSRQDLLDKVAFYLSHEDERKQMAEKGRKFALEHMTYDGLMKKTLQFLSEKIGEEE
jgi:hypothetical protein